MKVTSLEVQWLRLCLPMKWVRAQSLVRELRSHLLQDVAKIKIKNKFKQSPLKNPFKNHNEEQYKICMSVCVCIYMLVNTHTHTHIYIHIDSSALSSSFVTPCTVAFQTSLPMEFPRQDYWSGLPFPSPEDLPDPGIEPVSLVLAGRFFTTSTTWETP